MADGSQITRPAAPGRGRLSAPDDVWSAARADYLAGLTGPDVCRRHGVGIRALRWSRVRDLMEAGEAEIQRLMAQDDAIAFDRAGHAELAAMGAEDAG